MKLLTLFLLITGLLFTPSCGQFNLSGDRTGRGGDDEDLDLTRLDYESLWDILNDTSNCAEYHGYNSFRIVSPLFGLGPIVTQVENCLSKGLDQSVGTICLEEKRLDELERRHRNNDEALDQIDEYRASLEDIKAEMEDQLYVIADTIYEIEKDLEDTVEDIFDSGHIIDVIGRGFGIVAVSSEVGGFRRFIEIKARNLCGYNFFARRGDGRRGRD